MTSFILKGVICTNVFIRSVNEEKKSGHWKNRSENYRYSISAVLDKVKDADKIEAIRQKVQQLESEATSRGKTIKTGNFKDGSDVNHNTKDYSGVYFLNAVAYYQNLDGFKLTVPVYDEEGDLDLRDDCVVNGDIVDLGLKMSTRGSSVMFDITSVRFVERPEREVVAPAEPQPTAPTANEFDIVI